MTTKVCETPKINFQEWFDEVNLWLVLDINRKIINYSRSGVWQYLREMYESGVSPALAAEDILGLYKNGNTVDYLFYY